MTSPITKCNCLPLWVETALLRTAQFEEELEISDPESFAREVDNALAEIPFSGTEKFVNMQEWGKGGKRPKALPQGVKSRAGKSIYEATKNYHDNLPVDAIMSALAKHNLVAINEDGTKWQCMLGGNAECGTPEAANQRTTAQIATQDADGNWMLTTTWLSLSYCRMPSGRYEVVCYLS